MRSQNTNKLFNRVLECEDELKQLYNSGFNFVNLSIPDLDRYLRLRSKLRSTYERLILEEIDFASLNKLETKLWMDCFEKPINWIESALTDKNQKINNNLHLRSLRSILVSLLDEGLTLFQLILRSSLTNGKELCYNLSIYSSILLRKREHLLPISQRSHTPNTPQISHKSQRSFNLLQDTITSDPFKGLGYLTLARWAHQDGDSLLSIYWALISSNVQIKSDSYKDSLEFLKFVSRSIAISPSFIPIDIEDLNGRLIQMASHAILNQLTGKSHLKHLDQLSHSQIIFRSDLKSLKYSCTSLWLILGLFPDLEPVQSCLLAKLFQIHLEFINEPIIFNIFCSFSTNPNYSKLFSFKNYEKLSKINNFAYESLNKLLEKILQDSKFSIDTSVYFDYFVLESFKRREDYCEDLSDYFIKIGLFHKEKGSDEIYLTHIHEKNLRTERSMKLLTHRFLSTQLENLESVIEPVNLPWTIPDYQSFISNFSKIKRSVLGRRMKILITLPLLQELDLDKNKRPECRDIIKFLHDRINLGDPSVRLESKEIPSDPVVYTDYRAKLAMDHIESVKTFYELESKNIEIMCSESQKQLYIFQ